MTPAITIVGMAMPQATFLTTVGDAAPRAGEVTLSPV